MSRPTAKKKRPSIAADLADLERTDPAIKAAGARLDRLGEAMVAVQRSVITVTCPRCHAAPGRDCRSIGLEPDMGYHVERIKAARGDK